ncbi:unnamed protein product [Calypogeia fissa]
METPRRSSVSYDGTPRRSSYSRRSGHYEMGSLGYIEYDSGRASGEWSRQSFSSHMSIAGPLFGASPIAVMPGAGPYQGNNHYHGRYSSRRHQEVSVVEDVVVEMSSFVQKKSLNSRTPPLPILLKFVDVKYSLQVPAPPDPNAAKSSRFSFGQTNMVEKPILHGITGTVFPGEMLALMGPSGSGKTTVLNLLGGRLPCPQSGSTITYNDVAYCKPLRRRIGFVTQDDTLFPHLTVKETIVYAAMLRLPSSISMDGKIQRAEEIMFELGLDRCRDTIIGGPFLRGISGGERKRVCVGHEILIDPSLLFLDEPTSGLDSTTAMRLVQVLQNIAEAGRTVVTTIHQPSSRLFYMFDKLILLSQGSPVYSGEATECMEYFDSIGLEPLIAMNPADFLLDLASGNVNEISIPASLEQVARETPKSTYSNMEVAQPAVKDVLQYLVESYNAIIYPAEHRNILELGELKDEFRIAIAEKKVWCTSWWTQFSVLFVRGLKERRREYLSVDRFVEIAAIAFIAGLLWWQSKHDTERHLHDQVGLLFFIALFWAFFPLFTGIFTFPQERAMLAKERGADMYRLSAYFMSRTLADIPLDFLLPIVFQLVAYFMGNLRMTGEAFFLTLFIVFLVVMSSAGLGLAIGACVTNLRKATTMASVILVAFFMAGGFFVQHVPPFIKWLEYMSFHYWGYELLLKVQYKSSQQINCGEPTGCIPIEDSQALYGHKLVGGSKEVVILLAMIIFYRVVAYIGLRQMKVNLA